LRLIGAGDERTMAAFALKGHRIRENAALVCAVQSESDRLPGRRLAHIPGTKPDMDINVFNGTTAQLKAAWPLTKVAA
jgi:hypothetical protein